jgi:hypothetical protein
MFNKNIVISIGILIILSVLFERFTKKTNLNQLIKEKFETAAVPELYYEPKYNSDKTSSVTYSTDYSQFVLNLSNGFFKLENSTEGYMSYTGKITIQVTPNDYRDIPFDTADNIINCFRKWQYFKYDNKIYRMTIPKDTKAVVVTGKKEETKPAPAPAPAPAPKVGKCVGKDGMKLTNTNCNKNHGNNPDGCNKDIWCKWVEGFQNRSDTVEDFQNNILTLTFEFKSILEDETIRFKDELVLSELEFYTGPYEDINDFTKSRIADYATGLLGNLGAINEGVPCGWHYDEDTGAAGGYFSEILNDQEWQKDNPELYASLSKFICPSYLPVCTGQRTSGIVPGKCVTFKDNCNNNIVDNLMGIERPPWDTTRIVSEKERTYTNVIKKNIANREALTDTIKKLTDVLDEPSIETFENAEQTCNFHIENKCYDQYLEVDKNYYDTGAEIFNNVFPTTDQNVFKKTCYTVTHWISKNIVWLLFYKLIVGGLAALLYWSVNPHLDFQIRVFKSFIAFIFCEIYMLYNVYKHILKPTIVQRKPVTA